MSEVRLIGDWEKAQKIIEGMVNRFDHAVDVGLNRTGVIGRDQVKRGIRDQAPGGKVFTALSGLTVRTKGSSKALIDNGDLLNSITYQLDRRRKAAFVGVLRQAKDKDGGDLVNIAAVHEFGATIPVTPKMRGYFYQRFGIRLKKSTVVIRIPARSFLQATFDDQKFQQKIVDTFRAAISPVFRGESNG